MHTRVVALFLLAGAAVAADGPGRHPTFDDKGAIPWFTNLADAQAAAKKESKLVLIEYGREA